MASKTELVSVEKYEYNHAEADRVRRAAALGISHKNIAVITGVPFNIIQTVYKDELECGAEMAAYQIGERVLDRALQGDYKAQTFWLKHRSGWTDAQPIKKDKNDQKSFAELVKIYLPDNGRDGT